MGSNGDVLAEDDVPHLPCDACLEDGMGSGLVAGLLANGNWLMVIHSG